MIRRGALPWLLLALVRVAEAPAHVSPPSIELYGAFPPVAARCQRAIARAASGCLRAALSARESCHAAELAGGICDEAARDLAVGVAQQLARSQVAAACPVGGPAALVGFVSLAEAQANVSEVCAELATAATSAAFGPIAKDAVGTLAPAARRCVEATARATSRWIRLVARVHRALFDPIARGDLSSAARLAAMERKARRLENARGRLRQHLEAVCSPAEFGALYGRDAGDFLAAVDARAACFAAAVYVQSTVTCPPSACGNGIREPGEHCDDGDGDDADDCRNDCTSRDCRAFPSTYALIQEAIFEKRGCTDSLCHGSARQGGLDLRPASSHENLIRRSAQADPAWQRVVPASPPTSLLYRKLEAKTYGADGSGGLPGSPMPIGAGALSTAELEALRLWIHGGAPAEGVVDGTGALLDACLPAPAPLKVPPPPPPADGTGVQFAMPTLPMPPHSEQDLCVAGYYDLSAPGAVPAELLVDCAGQFPGTNDQGENAGKCFPYHTQEVVQDPQGHHLWETIYIGSGGYDDPGWGGWRCAGGAADGETCDPAVPAICGEGICASATSPGGPCSPGNFGPAEFSLGFLGLALSPVSYTRFPDGVFSVLPLKGILVWDSHAFNLTSQPTRMAAWANHEFAFDGRYPARFLFDVEFLYTQDVPPFETREYCATYTFEEGTRAFSYRAHHHKRGKRFRMWGPPQMPCGNGGPAPVGGTLRTDPACAPGEPADLFYQSFQYNDPVHYAPRPAVLYSGDTAQRTIKFCALYDNGLGNPAEVKRASTSPSPFLPGDPGGPCPPAERKCLGGPNQAQPCFGDDGNCPESVCDACNLRGGVTTDDEMFGIQVFYYFEDPPPK